MTSHFPYTLRLCQFDIHNSVILIDKLELHLRRRYNKVFCWRCVTLGENNQFIVTTHSDAVAAVTPETSLYRLEAD